MVFTPKEVSRAQGSPVALYFFQYGSDDAAYAAYTDAEHEITAPGRIAGADVVYVPASIMRKNISSSGTLDKSSIEVVIPRNLSLTSRFTLFPPSVVVSCVIRQGHLGEVTGDYPAAWVGRVAAFSFQGSQAVLGLEPFSTSMRRAGLRRNYQFGCPHVLYALGTCNADPTPATIAVTITGGTGSILTLPAAWFGAIPIAKYLSGTVRWVTAEGNTEIRMILQTIADQDLLLDGPILDLVNGDSVDILLGCNRQHGVTISGVPSPDGDCFNLHKEVVTGDPNSKNFGGQPWIPLKNPVGTTSSIF